MVTHSDICTHRMVTQGVLLVLFTLASLTVCLGEQFISQMFMEDNLTALIPRTKSLAQKHNLRRMKATKRDRSSQF